MNLQRWEASSRVISGSGINQMLHCQGINQYGQVLLISMMDLGLNSYRFLNGNIFPQNKTSFIHYKPSILGHTFPWLLAISTGCWEFPVEPLSRNCLCLSSHFIHSYPFFVPAHGHRWSVSRHKVQPFAFIWLSRASQFRGILWVQLLSLSSVISIQLVLPPKILFILSGTWIPDFLILLRINHWVESFFSEKLNLQLLFKEKILLDPPPSSVNTVFLWWALSVFVWYTDMVSPKRTLPWVNSKRAWYRRAFHYNINTCDHPLNYLNHR